MVVGLADAKAQSAAPYSSHLGQGASRSERKTRLRGVCKPSDGLEPSQLTISLCTQLFAIVGDRIALAEPFLA